MFNMLVVICGIVELLEQLEPLVWFRCLVLLEHLGLHYHNEGLPKAQIHLGLDEEFVVVVLIPELLL